MMEEIVYYSVSKLSERWGFSETKVSRLLEKFRGHAGFLDFGDGNRRNKRKYSIIRIHPMLVKEIEGGAVVGIGDNHPVNVVKDLVLSQIRWTHRLA
jgi:hypothetical protein